MDKSTWIFNITLLLLLLAAVASYFSSKKDNKLVDKLTIPLIICVLILSSLKEILDKSQKEADRINQEKKESNLIAADEQRDRERKVQDIAEQRRDRERKAQDSVAQSEAQHSLDSLGLQMNWVTGKLSEKPTVTSRVEREIRTVYVPSAPVSKVGTVPTSIVAMPARRSRPVIDPELAEALKEEAITTNISENELKSYELGNYPCNGKFRIRNLFSERLLLRAITGGGHVNRRNPICDILIGSGATELTPVLQAGNHDKGTCEPETSEYKFYFESEDSKRFGVLTLYPEMGKVRTKVITPDNLSLRANGARYKP